MRSTLKRNKEAPETQPVKAGRERTGGSRDRGFALPMVLFMTTLIALLGATTLIMAAYAMINARSSMPAAKAFDIAEAGISAAHAMIVTGTTMPYKNVPDAIPPAVPATWPAMLEGTYNLQITQSGTDYTITSTGNYVEDGQTYQRKIEEQISYQGNTNAFNFLSNYLMYAGNDINITSGGALFSFGKSLTVNGNMRAEHNINIKLIAAAIATPSFIFNNNIESGNNISITASGYLFATATGNFNSSILTHGTCSLSTSGWLGTGYININGPLQHNGLSKSGNISPSGLTGTTPYTGPPDVTTLEPDYDYYKAIAKQQGNYYEGVNKSFSGSFTETGSSAITVYYVAKDSSGNGGNINVTGSWTWANTNMAGIFVCEGDFTQSASVTIQSGCKMQVIAKGNAKCDDNWTIATDGTPQFFFYASGDVNLSFALFAGCRMTAFAKNDINCTSVNILSIPMTISPNPNFALDVRGWPIPVTVKSWKELPIP